MRISERLKVYLCIFLVSALYMGYMVRDGKWFFFDDFAAMRYVADRSYREIVINSFVTRDVDYHKFVGYLVIKFLYTHVGTRYFPYLFVNFLVHTLNSILVFEILWRWVDGSDRKDKSNKSNIEIGAAVVLACVFCVRFWMWWPSNLHDMLAGTWFFGATILWLRVIANYKSFGFAQDKLQIANLWIVGLYLLGLGTKATVAMMPISFALLYAACQGINGQWKMDNGQLRTVNKFPIPNYQLSILIVLMVGYGAYFGRYFLEGRHEGTGYATSFSVVTYIMSQAKFLGSVGINGWLSIGVLGVIALWLRKKEIWILILAYMVTVLPTSFFARHASSYYIYIPVIFLLMMVGKIIKLQIFKLQIANFLFTVIFCFLIFNPFAEARKMVVKYRHPELVGFDQNNSKKLVELTKRAVDNGETEFYFSDWEMSPNLYSLVYHNALGLWLSEGKYDDYKYDYDRPRERVVVRVRDLGDRE